MANQNNFRTDITTPLDATLVPSRVIRYPEEGILIQQIPATFGFGPNNNVEIHFYTAKENLLLLSTVVSLSDAFVTGSHDVYTETETTLKSFVVNNTDGTFTNYIRINYTKLFEEKQITLIPGDYKVTLNFFDDEIGGYYNRELYVEKISPNRKEVELAFTDNAGLNRSLNEEKLREFIELSLPKPFAIGASEKIFSSGVKLGDSSEGITYNNLTGSIESLGYYDTTIRRVKNIDASDAALRIENGSTDSIDYAISNGSVMGPLETSLMNYIESVSVRMHEKTLKNNILQKTGDYRIQESEFQLFISNMITTASNNQYANYADTADTFRDNRIILK